MNRLIKIVENNLLPEMVLLDVIEHRDGNFVRVIVDGERPITINETSELIRKIKHSDDMISEYPNGLRIEVTTPGLENSLEFPFQYKKNIGRKLKIKIENEERGFITETGKVVFADERSVTLDQEGSELVVDYNKIMKAIVKLEFK